MKTHEIKTYSINELSEESQQKAFENWLNEGFEYFWSSENEQTLKAFEEVFPVKIGNWEYGYRNYINFQFTEEPEIEELTGIRLLKYIVNNYWYDLFNRQYRGTIKNDTIKHKRVTHKKLSNGQFFNSYYSGIFWDNSCVLTGYCIDDNILQPIYDFLKKPDKLTTFYDLMNECLQNWVEACNADYEACTSFDYFKDHAEANEFKYLSDGRMYY